MAYIWCETDSKVGERQRRSGCLLGMWTIDPREGRHGLMDPTKWEGIDKMRLEAEKAELYEAHDRRISST